MRRLAFALVLFGCGTVTPTPTPAPTDYAAICLHLVDLGCSEGAAPTCAVDFARFHDNRLTNLKPECLARAQSQSDARACGSVACE